MNLSRFKYQLHTTFIMFVCIISSATSSVVLDFSESGGHLQIVGFSTKSQQVVHYEKRVAENVARPLKNFLTQYHPNPATDLELNFNVEYTVGGKIKITRAVPAANDNYVPHAQYIIMCDTEINTQATGSCVIDNFLKKRIWLSSPVLEKTPTEIKNFVPNLKKATAGEFAIIHVNPAILQLSQLKKEEKGKIGELITRMTMYSFGYNVLKSIYSGNQGLDGIFRGVANGFIIISQSKMGNSNDRAPTVIKKELNEKHMCERLDKMDANGCADVKASATAIRNLLQEHPHKLYKMALCVLDSGKAQLEFDTFKVENVPRNTIKLYGTPEAEKTRAIEENLEMFSADPHERLRIALLGAKANQLPAAEAMAIFLNVMGLPN